MSRRHQGRWSIGLPLRTAHATFASEQIETGEGFKIACAVLEKAFAMVEDGKRALLTYKGKPENTYLVSSVVLWGNETEL